MKVSLLVQMRRSLRARLKGIAHLVCTGWIFFAIFRVWRRGGGVGEYRENIRNFRKHIGVWSSFQHFIICFLKRISWDKSNYINNFGTTSWFAPNDCFSSNGNAVDLSSSPAFTQPSVMISLFALCAGILAVGFIDCLTPYLWKTLLHGMMACIFFLTFSCVQFGCECLDRVAYNNPVIVRKKC